MSTYAVKEVFYTLQGEGMRAGRPAVFLRFARCNLWSGDERDRDRAVCRFCDTDFVGTDGPGGGVFRGAAELAAHVAAHWPTGLGGGNARAAESGGNARAAESGGNARAAESGRPYVVCTGGEPLLQLDPELVDALHDAGFEVAIETNGTLPVPAGVDWVCVSPKAGAPLVVTTGDELKLVHPQTGAEPERFEHLTFTHLLLQPMDGPDREAATRATVEHCLAHPRWRLSLQTHKLLGIP